MLSKLYNLFQYAYIIAAAFAIYTAIDIWNTDPNKAYLFLFFAVVFIFMFFFKRRFRKMIDENKKR